MIEPEAITTSALSGVELSVNGKAFKDITAKNGARFTGVSATNATLTLYTKNDTATDSASKYVYKVTSAN